MKAAIILVGTELLNGGMVDTNSIYIAEELNKYGVEIELKIAVRDFKKEIFKTIDYCKKNVDLIIMSGGLGPTIDDITKEVIADYLGKKLIIDPKELEILKEKFRKRNIEFKEHNLKEVEVPEGAIIFPNDVGMAPAIFIEGIAAFPGVPRELYNMLPKFLEWYFESKKDKIDKIYIKDLIVFGMAESLIEFEIKEFFTEPEIYYEFLVKEYGILIRLQTKMSNKNKVEKIVKKIYNRIGKFIIGEDNERLETKIVELIKKLGMKISVAESCTGGLLASKLIDVPGVSEVFKEGIVCYSNQSKIDRLGVKNETLKEYGAVSEEVAKEMVKGLDTEIVLSTTGIAGPDGGTKEKPVGLVYVGIKVKENIYIKKLNIVGDRSRVRKRAVLEALYSLLKILNEDV